MSFKDGDGEDDDFGGVFQAVYIPKQNPPPPILSSPMMRVSLTCYPPLGQLTVFPQGPIAVSALLDIDPSRAKDNWEVSLWHSKDGAGGDWSTLPLTQTQKPFSPSTLQALDENLHRVCWAGELLTNDKSVHFTLKFRHGVDSPWRWIRDETGMQDGTLLIKDNVPRWFSSQLSDYIPDLNTKLHTRSLLSQSPNTMLWSAVTTVQGVQDDTSVFAQVDLGTPWGSFLRWFALVRLWQPWMAPRHGKTRFELDRDAILCCFQNHEGKHLAVLGLSGLNNVSTVFRNGDNGNVSLKIRNDGAREETATVLIAVGDEADNAIASVMYEARTRVMRAKEVSHELEKEQAAVGGEFKPQWIEMWYDGLGYCTWNGLGQQLTEEKVFNAVDTLAQNDIKITSLIIDDNWQSIDYEGDGQFQYGWLDFEADPKAFPSGLRKTVQHIRSKHPTIHHVAVWHAMLGYWGGINPNGKLAQTYKTIEVVREEDDRRNLPLGGNMHIIAKEDVVRFYGDFYSFLHNSGVDAVKTDGQFMSDMWTSAQVRRDHIKTYIDAWTVATLRYFGSKAISCMSQTPTLLFYSQMATNRPAFLCRNSDDFIPHIESSHPWHIFGNAYNTLFTQHLNILPDWDMFQTVHDYSEFHAAARCVSGGPIYITDIPGEHNIDLIKQMTGKTPRGKTVIFRTSVLGRSIDTYVGYHDDVLLKVGSYNGRADAGTPILATFNISNRPLTELIPLSRFRGVDPSKHYVVRAHTTKRVTNPVQIDTPESLLALTLGVRGYEIFTAFPITSFESATHGGMIWAGALGLVDKMAGAAALRYNHVRLQNDRVFFEAVYKAFGVSGFFISVLPDLSLEDDFIATMHGQVVPPHTVTISKEDPRVLEVDLEMAWKEIGLRPGWSNEVEVKVYFNLEKRGD